MEASRSRRERVADTECPRRRAWIYVEDACDDVGRRGGRDDAGAVGERARGASMSATISRLRDAQLVGAEMRTSDIARAGAHPSDVSGGMNKPRGA